MRLFTISILCVSLLSACAQDKNQTSSEQDTSDSTSYSVVKTEAEWKAALSTQEYRVIREKGTERAGTGDLLHNKEEGTYHCRACGNALYTSDTKFDSGTGWPSFYDCIEGAVEEDTDSSHGMLRTEILCADCGGHLGHVFNDGPNPTGLRHCVNSVSLDFEEKE